MCVHELGLLCVKVPCGVSLKYLCLSLGCDSKTGHYENRC